MGVKSPFDLVRQMAALLDELGIPYALGGSMASSLLGEPRSTIDVDMAVRLDDTTAEALLQRASAIFYVPVESAREAVRARSSFNLVDVDHGLKVDLFVVGDGLLDRMQIERRTLIAVPGAPAGIWVTSPEDQVLRKLDWFRQGGSLSDRQWRDVVGILRIHGAALDLEYLSASARALGLMDDLTEARSQATTTD
ncbi:MAG: hypothetical protein JWM47_1229 [Acidimicrobiales bacterium]|nr:hypothetical protein [Acidimicrobiales bacterium]